MLLRLPLYSVAFYPQHHHIQHTSIVYSTHIHLGRNRIRKRIPIFRSFNGNFDPLCIFLYTLFTLNLVRQKENERGIAAFLRQAHVIFSLECIQGIYRVSLFVWN